MSERGPGGRFVSAAPAVAAPEAAEPEPAAAPPEVAARSPERVALAAAIDRRAEAETRQQRTQQALGRATELWRSAYTAEDRAKMALAEAAERGDGRWLADALLAEREPGIAPVRAAERALALAAEASGEAYAARQVLEAQLREEQRAAEDASRRVREAAARVIGASPAVEALVARAEATQAELVASGALLRWLVEIGAVSTWRAEPLGHVVAEGRLAQVLRRFETAPIGWPGFDRPAGGGVFETALAELMADADAALPE